MSSKKETTFLFLPHFIDVFDHYVCFIALKPEGLYMCCSGNGQNEIEIMLCFPRMLFGIMESFHIQFLVFEKETNRFLAVMANY